MTPARHLDDLLREILEQIADIVEVDTALIMLLGSDGRTLAAGSAAGLEEEIARRLRMPIGRPLGGGGRRALAVEDVTAADGLDPLLREHGIHSLLAVPLVIDERFVGLLLVGTLTTRSFTEQDARLLQVLADRAALEIEDGGLLEEHRRAWALQRSQLPQRMPDIPGVALAARYLPARATAGVGGGWYDAFVLRDGRVALAVGDVAGRGERAAVITAELRNALRAYALDGDPPAAVASRMWQFLATHERGEMATFLYALYDPAGGHVRYYSAGHPGPVFVAGDGTVSFGPVTAAAPLGVGGPPRDEENEAELTPGTTMLLYTEGLAERPGDRLAERRARLAHEAGMAPNDPQSLCGSLVHSLLGGRRPADDVALLAVQEVAVPEDVIRRTVPALAEALAPLRRYLRRWLAACGADEHETAAITLAVQEACANAVEHAYGLADDTFELEAIHHGPVVEITIRDRGHWRPPRGHDRGRGLALMRALVDDVEVRPDDDGTTVRLHRRLAAAAAP
jgi:anti-sigma regulatory factor (Ser/Thr protein kinase)/GAF domain-containing protein